jgi:predicted ATPase
MFISKIKLHNFRCFQQAEIDFSNITILTGANSSGKSSLIYSILGALQAKDFPRYYSPNGKYINMGDYKELVYKHNIEIPINLYSEINKDEEIIKYDTNWIIDFDNRMPVLNSLHCNSEYFSLRLNKGKKYSLDLNYDPTKDKIDKDEMKLFRTIDNLIKEKYINININKTPKLLEFKNIINLTDLDLENIFSDVSNKFKYDYRLIKILQLSFSNFTNLNGSTNYISSFRLHPERTYYQRTGDIRKIGHYGEGYVDQILLWELNKKKEFEELNQILNKLKISKKIKSSKLQGGRYEFLVKTYNSSLSSSLLDVGFGISQFLPIIVTDLQLPHKSTLFLSQPEIHLHPSVQADFSNYIVDQVNEKEKRYIIETHSEYILNRIRLLLIEGKIKEDNVKIYHFINDKEGTKIYEIKINKKGQILNAPKDFFDTYLIDTMNIALRATE